MSAGDFVHFRIERECDISSSSSHGSASSGSTLASINYGTIFTALQDVAQERYFPYLPDHLISDAIKDAHELVEAFITKSDSEENEVNTSIPLALRPLSFNGNKYLVEQGKFVRSNPIAENSLRLIMHETDDSKFCSLTFSHRYVLWKWFYVLRMLLRVWREECSIDDVSNYQATSDTSSTNAADSLNLRVPGVSISMNGVSYDGGSGAKVAKGAGGGLMAESVTAALDVAKAFKISIDGGRSIDLTNLKAIVISADCYAETGISLQFGFDHFDINETTSAEKKRPSLTGSLQIGTMVSSVAQLAEEATLGTAKRAKNVVKNTASILATTIGASKRAEENGSSFFTSRQRDYFLLKYLSGNQFVEAKKTDSSSESEYFQLDCFVPTSKMMANVIRFPFERCDALLFLYKAGIPQPVAAKVLEYEEIENWSKLSRDQLPAREMDRVSRLMNDFNNPLREVCSTVNINMDANIDLCITVLRAEGIATAAKAALSAVSVAAKCRMVNAGRHMLDDTGSPFVGSYDANTGVVEWDSASWRHKLHDHVEELQYVRVELIFFDSAAGGGNGGRLPSMPTIINNHDNSLGAIFIPLSSFTHHAKELVFPVDDFRQKNNLRRRADATTSPTVTVLIQLVGRQASKMSDSSNNLSSLIAPKAQQQMMREASVVYVNSAKVTSSVTAQIYPPYDVWYQADSILAGEVTAASSVPVEKLYVRFGRRALLLETNQELAAVPPEWAALKLQQPLLYHYLWRKAVLTQYPQAILRVCEEAHAKSSRVFIDYSQIEKFEVISPGLICITVTIRRYFPGRAATGSKDKEKDPASEQLSAATNSRFVPASLDLYVFNVRSKHIATLLDDRRHFASIRRNFLSIVLGNQYEDEDSRASDAVVLSIEMDHMAETCSADIHRILDNVTDDDIAQMITSGVGGGSNGRRDGTAKHLYDNSSSKVGEEFDPAAATIPMHAANLSSEKHHLPMQVWTEVRRVGSRECRLRMYEAALYGIGLQGAHDFNPAEVQALLQADIAESQAILAPPELNGADVGSHSSMGFSSHSSSGKQRAEEDAAERFASACQFLVAMAEKRIRETAIAGWSRRGEGKELDQCLVMLVEGYFNAILTTMRPLFVKERFDQIKGLQVKLRYITFVLQHPDQWKTFLASALRPYRLHVSPEPRISSYIHPEQLIAWYHEAIHKDMLVRVRHIFQVWQDQALNNNGAGTAAGSQSDKNSLYTCDVVPWIPQRDQPDGGAFFSGIPEDCISILLIYLQSAVLKSEDIHEKYTVLVGNAQREVLCMYIDMFLAVQQGYEAALAGDSLDGGGLSSTTTPGGGVGASKASNAAASGAPSAAGSAATSANKAPSGPIAPASAPPSARHVVLQSEEMAAEYATWICSVANDCHRMRSRQMITKDVPNFLQPLLQSDKGTKAALRRVHARLDDTVHHAMEQLSSIIFHVIFQERGQWSNYDQIIQSIVAAAATNNSSSSTSTAAAAAAAAAAANGSGIGDTLLSDAEYVPLAKDIRHCIEDFSSFLHPVCVIEYLLPICEDRLAAFLLSWLRAMRNRGLVLHHEENHTLEAAIALEIDALLHFREKLLHFLGYSDRSSMLSTLIGYCRTLLLADIHAPEMIVTLKTVLQHAKTQPEDANALLRWLKVAWSLRGFRKYFTASATMAKAVQHVKDNATNVAATTTGSLGSVVTGSASVAVAAANAVVQLGVNATNAGSNAIRSRSADHGLPNANGAAANANEGASLDERHSFDPSSLSSSSGTASRPRFWRPFAALWARGGKARDVNEEGSMKDTSASTAARVPSDERSLPVGASSHSASFWQKLVASDQSSAVGALTSSESGRFTAEMATLREQMQMEWIDQLMSDLQRIAEDYDARRPASTAGKISPLTGVTDAAPAGKPPTPEPAQLPPASLTSKRSSRFARWRRRRPLLRVYDRLFTKSPPPLPASSSDPRELLVQSPSVDNALDDHDDDRSTTATIRSDDADADDPNGHVEDDDDPVAALPAGGPSSDAQTLQDLIPLLRWCFDSKQFDFRVSAIFQLHACKAHRSDETDASNMAANAAGVAGGAVMQLGQGGRILLTSFGHVVAGGVNTAVTLVNKSSSLLAATTTSSSAASSSPSAAPAMRRPWLSLFRRSQSTKRLGAGPWSTSSSTKSAETFGSPDKFRDAAVSQLSLAEQLNLLDIDGVNAAAMSPVSPRSPFTPQVHYQVRISQIRVVGTLRFVLFAQPKFALQFRVGTQVFVTRPSPMLTHFPTSAAAEGQGQGQASASENWYDFAEEEMVFVWTGKASASAPSMTASSLTTSTHPTVYVALLDTGVLVDQTLANVSIPLPVPEAETVDAVGGGAEAAVEVVSAQQLRPFTSFSSALRVQRAVKVTKQGGSSSSDASALPQLACSITIARLR